MSTYQDRARARQSRSGFGSLVLPTLVFGAIATAVVALKAWALIPAGQF